MRLPFFSPSSSVKKDKKVKKAPSLSRSDPPSFSSSTSSDPATTPKTILPKPKPNRIIIGRNASCLDAEYYSPPVLPCPSLRRDPDGKITREELHLVLSRLGGGREEELAELLAEADLDGDGRISMEEFLMLVKAQVEEKEGEDMEELRVAFKVYDMNGDGKISAEELFEVFRMLGDEACSIEDCRRMIGGVDSDGDGFVCFKDFAKMMSMTTAAIR